MTRLTSDAWAYLPSAMLLIGVLACPSCISVTGPRSGEAGVDISSIGEIEVKTAGVRVSCNAVDQQISGQVLYITRSGERRPVRRVVFVVASGSEEGRSLNIRVDVDGQFAGDVVLWDHWIGTAEPGGDTEFIPGRTLVSLRSPGCDDATLDVGHDWEPTTVIMACPGR